MVGHAQPCEGRGLGRELDFYSQSKAGISLSLMLGHVQGRQD